MALHSHRAVAVYDDKMVFARLIAIPVGSLALHRDVERRPPQSIARRLDLVLRPPQYAVRFSHSEYIVNSPHIRPLKILNKGKSMGWLGAAVKLLTLGQPARRGFRWSRRPRPGHTDLSA